MPSEVARYTRIVLGEAMVASLAATAAVMLLDVPIWAMFVGWIAYFTRGLSLRHGVLNLACVLMGVGLGMVAAHALAVAGPVLGAWAPGAVVFCITIVALSLGTLPYANNILACFLGLVAFFASHLPPTAGTWLLLAMATGLGTLAGWLAHALQRRIQRGAPA
ncbi:DUF1097 domain-containing protein [Coralloluteibacterium thermophilus]|uniref:DUF1097 domain-containing protein n=1 Tax=Coralloluteibacterium thermophilum TaxID=2707049 RepID=A0ABV9NRR8_9GAMM